MNIQPRTSYPFHRLVMPLMLGFLVALGLALVLADTWMGAPQRDVLDLVQYLLVSGAVSLGLGAVGVLWLRRGHLRLWLQLVLTFLFGVAAAMFNIYLTASLMFISEHDLPLLVLLLTFAAVISIGLGYALARALAQRVATIAQGAQALAAGDLAVRVPEQGDDELAQLARAFNQMAGELYASAAEREALEESRRNLFAAISHDLRTPLASLRVMTEALADGMVDDPATTARYLATMRGQIGQLNHLIDDLFEVARIDAGALKLDLQRVIPGVLVGDAVDGIQAQASEKGITLRCEAEANLPPLFIAPPQIGRVLSNILSNAIRHTPSGGSVTLFAKALGNYVVFEVSDTGEGIAPEDLPHILERFYRGEKSRSRATGGAGLGLAIAKGIVEAHGGAIWVESTLGRGTQVRFTVPSERMKDDG